MKKLAKILFFFSVATRDLDQTPYFRCFVFDRTAQYKDRYPALERACYLQVAVEQYVGVTTED